MNALNRIGPLAGRILIALIFVLSGYGKLTRFAGTVGYIASKGVPLAELAAVAAIVVELGGGLLLVLGWKARSAAAALIVFTALTALVFHNFWGVPADQAQNQLVHFLKNVSMLGGLLYVVVHGSGPISVDGREAGR
jgi:putative oxidoreductase